MDIRDRAFILGLGVDRTEAGQLSVSVQIPHLDPSGPGAGGAILLAAPGADFLAALHHVQGRMSRVIFLGQLKVVVLGETAARDPKVVEDVVDEVLRHPQVDPGAFLLVARGCSAQEVMAMSSVEGTPSAVFVGTALEKSLLGLEVPRSEVWQFLRALQTPGWDPVCGGIKCSPSQVEMADTAVFKDYRMVGWLGPHETRGYLWLIGESEGAVVNIPSPYGLAATLVTEVEARHRPRPGRPPSIDVQVSVAAQLLHKPPLLTILTHEDTRQLASLLAQRVKVETGLALEKLQVLYQADAVGLGREFYYRTPYFWQTLNWEQAYPGLDIRVTVKANLGRKGQLR